jgi:hypothetical protein
MKISHENLRRTKQDEKVLVRSLVGRVRDDRLRKVEH